MLVRHGPEAPATASVQVTLLELKLIPSDVTKELHVDYVGSDVTCLGFLWVSNGKSST